jgi:hypothetical protein
VELPLFGQLSQQLLHVLLGRFLCMVADCCLMLLTWSKPCSTSTVFPIHFPKHFTDNSVMFYPSPLRAPSSTRSFHLNDCKLSGGKILLKGDTAQTIHHLHSLRMCSPAIWVILFLILGSFIDCRAIDR